MNIPFVDLHSQYLSIKPEIDKAINDVIFNTDFIGGKPVADFEMGFSKYLGTDFFIGCGNGTDALEISLQVLGVKPGDEVLVPAISWIATSEAVTSVGGKPVFVDVDPDYFTINPSLLEEKITSKTVGVIPVHLYGHPAQMEEIMRIAKKHDLFVLEDCAQAHGATFKGKKTGTMGDMAAFSFYPGKNLGAYGDAGGIATNKEEYARKARMISNHGQLKKHDHKMEGRNSRLDGIQAAILNVKLNYLEKWTEKRINAAGIYNELLKNSNIEIPKVHPDATHVYHLYVVKTTERDLLINKLQNNNIATGVHYPTALPFLEAYKSNGYKPEDFPIAFNVTKKILSLPLFPELTEVEQQFVVKTIRNN